MNGKTAKLIRKSLNYRNDTKQKYTTSVGVKEKYHVDTVDRKPVVRSISGEQQYRVAVADKDKKPAKKLMKRIVAHKVTIAKPNQELRANYQLLKSDYNALPRPERARVKQAMCELLVP